MLQSKRNRTKQGATRQCMKHAVLAASLVASAFCMALAVGSSTFTWLAWISLLPLFLAIRALVPVRATLAGAFWGICLYLFSVTGDQPAISPAARSLILLTAIPGAYVGLGALLTRRIGFNPIMLSLGWILVEVGLKPLGLPNGLLASTQIDGGFGQVVGRLLGTVFVAFAVACANASLLAVLSGARLEIPRLRSCLSWPDVAGRVYWSLSSPVFSLASGCIARPRAPPA